MDKEKLLHLCKKIIEVEGLLNRLIDNLLEESGLTRQEVQDEHSRNIKHD